MKLQCIYLFIQQEFIKHLLGTASDGLDLLQEIKSILFILLEQKKIVSFYCEYTWAIFAK